MEQTAKLRNAVHSYEHGRLARKLLRNWSDAAFADGVSCVREINTCGVVLGMASIAATGFPHPGLSCRIEPRIKNGSQHKANNRIASFYDASNSQ